MTSYQIENIATGLILGTYEATSEDHALDVMARDAGYENFAASCEAIGHDADAARDELAVTVI